MHAARFSLAIALVMMEVACSFCSEFLQPKVGSFLSDFVVVVDVEGGSVVVMIAVTEVLGNKVQEVGALPVVVVALLLLLMISVGPYAICMVGWVEPAHSPLALLLAVEFPILLFCLFVLFSRWCH